LKGLNEDHKEILLKHSDMKSLSSLLSIKRRIIDRMASEGFTVDGTSKKSLSMNRNKETKRERISWRSRVARDYSAVCVGQQSSSKKIVGNVGRVLRIMI
jgi:hypothetical protein